MVLVSFLLLIVNVPLTNMDSFNLYHELFYFLCSLLLGIVFPLMWYYATILYFGNYYRKDPRERAGLAANAIAVSI